MTAYHADVTVRFRLLVEGHSIESAESAARQAACLRPGIRGNISGIFVAPLTVMEQLNIDNLRTWQEMEAVRTRGNDAQRERWGACCLPEDELLELARQVLFEPLALFMKRQRLLFASIPHPRAANGIWTCVSGAVASRLDSLVDWSTATNPELSAGEWKTLQQVLDAAWTIGRHPWMRLSPPEAVSVQPREHRGVCKRCDGAVVEHTALVSIQWAGRTLSREYVL